MSRHLLLPLSLLALLLGAAPAEAQHCFADTRYDDATFENAIGPIIRSKAHFVMRLDPPAAATLERVCLCWVTNNPDPNLTFDLLVWDADGPDGAPGTLLRRLESLEARDVPTRNPGRFYDYDLADPPLEAAGPVYVGPAWDAVRFPGFFLCTDFNGPSVQPGYYANGVDAGVTAPRRPLGVDPPFQDWVAFGLRAVFTGLSPFSLRGVAELIVPGYDADLASRNGPTTLFGLRNTSAEPLAFELEYHGHQVTETPRRLDAAQLPAGASHTYDVRDDPTGLDPDGDELATGLLLVRRGAAGPLPLEGEYFRVDFNNDFATGERLVRPEDFCDVREVRFLDFGGGTQLRILLDSPRGDAMASYTYEVYDEPGNPVGSGERFTSDHLSVVDAAQLAPPGVSFGTVIFDFTAAGGGWVSAAYSAFGRFSAETASACRD